MKRLCVFMLCACVLAAGRVSAEETVTLATLDWEPYIGETLVRQGYVAEVVREAFKRSGYRVELRFLPWARVLHAAKAGDVDGYLPEYFSESLEVSAVFSDPFAGGPLGFFKRREDSIAYRTLEDLRPYRIGVVRGYVNTAEFDRAAFLKKDEAVDDAMNFRKLISRRVDLAVADKYVGNYILQHLMPESLDQIVFVEPPLEEKKLYVCFLKERPRTELLLKKFNEGLQSLIADGTLDAIMQAQGFSAAGR